MAWNDPPAVSAGDDISASDYNVYTKDNLIYCHSGKPVTAVNYSKGSDYSVASASFADIDPTNLSITLSITTGRALVLFSGTFYSDGDVSALMGLDIAVDGTRQGNSGGWLQHFLTAAATMLSLVVPVVGLSTGSHVFRPQWKIGGGTSHLFSNTSSNVAHFAVFEM